MNHQGVLSDFSFAVKPSSLSSTSDETEGEAGASAEPGAAVAMEHLELDGTQQQQHDHDQQPGSGRKKPLKQIGKKIGGAFSKINIAKWIDDLEQDQQLADQLDRVNADNADEAERQEICRHAMELCLKEMRDHLLEFLSERPLASYEEWISELHPDNINGRSEGLTHTPLIDHRFYVADSDHRILWNEHLNDLDDPTNMTPVRRFVAARSFNTPTHADAAGTSDADQDFDFFAAATPHTTATTNQSMMDHPLATVVSNDHAQDGAPDLISF